MAKQEIFDAVVVGSGATGGWAAKELTQKGLRVAVVEAGRKLDPFYDTAASGIGGILAAGSLFGAGNSHGTSTEFNADALGGAYVADHLAYRSPAFHGFTGNVAVFLDEPADTADEEHGFGVGAEYLADGITAGVHLAVVLLRDLIQSKNRFVNLSKAIGAAILVVVIIVGGLGVSAMLGGNFGWNVLWTVRHFSLTDHELGLNWKTLARVILILIVATVFFWSIRKDLKAFFNRS